MRQWIRDYLNFNQSEKRGILVLALLIILAIAAPYFIRMTVSPETVPDSDFVERAMLLLEERKKKAKAATWKTRTKDYQQQPAVEIEYFEFDPNHLPEDKWAKLGLKKWQIKIIRKFENKGGSFRIKSDLKKMYPINDSLYALLEPYILLPDTLSKPKKFEKKKWKEDDSIIELNTADSTQLISLKGVGPAISRMIIKYRDLLGGFHSISQLEEVYYMKPEVVDQNNHRLEVDPAYIHKLNINSLTAEELKNHAYIDWSIANSIVSIREQHGPYQDIKEVQKSHLINEDTYRKLAHYLTID